MKLRAAAFGLVPVVIAMAGLRARADAPLIQFRVALVHADPAAPEIFSREELNAALLVETNRVRAANGLRPLKPLAALAAAADDQAAFMAMTMEVTHANWIRGQRDVLERVKRHGLRDASQVAENALSTGFAAPRVPPPSCAEVAAGLVAQWMDSPGHRANLLNRAFTDLGCATRRANFIGGAGIFAAQVFAAR